MTRECLARSVGSRPSTSCIDIVTAPTSWGPALARRGRGCARRDRDESVDGHAVDALACRADEGRGHAAIHLGERLARDDPRVPEWGNPAGDKPRRPGLNA